MNLYAKQVANNPGILILVIFAFTSISITITLMYDNVPSFKDPLLGYEARGTPISSKIQAYKHLKEEAGWNGALTVYPKNIVNLSVRSAGELVQEETSLAPDFDSVNERDLYEEESKNLSQTIPMREVDENSLVSEDDAGKIIYEKNTHGDFVLYEDDVDLHLVKGKTNFFLNNPRREYAHVIFKSVKNDNLFTLKNMLSVCLLDEERLRNSSNFVDICEETAEGEGCSKSWSLPNYIALLGNKSSCRDIDETDVQLTLELLKFCSPFYHDLKLSHDCDTEPAICRDVPMKCAHFNAVYIILHFLADVNFLNPRSGDMKNPKLSYTTVFLPCAQSSSSLAYYRDLEKMKLSDQETQVIAMELGLKYILFSECLIHDTIYIGLAGLLIFIVLSIYSSFFVTIMTMLAIAFSLGLTYFMYSFVYRIKFFPFINLLTIVIMIGIGVDDACVYYKLFFCSKKSNTNLTRCVRDTLHHAFITMFVTSFTTSVAFFASVVSNITAVKCFSIFSGTAVLANFIFTVSWLPASVVLAEKLEHCWHPPKNFERLSRFTSTHLLTSLTNCLTFLYSISDALQIFFENKLPLIIKRFRYIFVLIFTSLAAVGSFLVFCNPRLRIPKSKEFQVFSSDHPFEVYSFLKEEFFFERETEKEIFRNKLPIRIVSGILPIDNGDYFNPVDRGSIIFDPEFEISDPKCQQWLLDLCIDLRNQSFYQPQDGPLIYNCFLESFKKWMERQCIDRISMSDRRPCCESSKFPYKKSVFDLCIKEAVTMAQTTGYSLNLMHSQEGPWFSKSTGDVVAIVVQYQSTYAFSHSYQNLFEFKNAVEAWLAKRMEMAPTGMKNTFFTTDLEFFSLQESLLEGTFLAIGVAIAVSFCAVLITTLNLLIAILAIITVSSIIIVTIAILILLGWELNVLESTSIAIAIGLAVDLTLHYAVAYKMCNENDRESSVYFAVSRVGSPVAIASLTTFLAGSLMLFSVILAYIEIGKFMVILTTVSYCYATFFFLSLCYIVGPENGNFQWNYPSFSFCETPISVEKPAYALSESTLSSSSSYPNQLPISEIHELEPLTNINHADTSKCNRKHLGHHSCRPRSGSCSRTKDLTCLNPAVGHTCRKVSLPSLNVVLHSDQSPKHVTNGTSSSTLVYGEDDVEDATTVNIDSHSIEDVETSDILRKYPTIEI